MDYQSLAAEYARKYNLDPNLFSRVIGQESSWNPNAVSPKGAQGLSQAIPSTARDPGFGVTPLSNPNDPNESLRFGAEYLSALSNRYGGDTNKALAAYNWGVGNVDKWDGNMETLPPETRNYIQTINPMGPQPASQGALSVSTANGPAGPMDNVPFGQEQPQPEVDNRWIAKFLPDMSKQQRNDRLLAVGAGLLSGHNWSEGLAGAAQNLMGVRSSEQQQGIDMARIAAASGGTGSSNTPYQIKGRDKDGRMVVRMATMKDGQPHIYGDNGQLVPASSVLSNIQLASRGDDEAYAEGYGGIPNADYVNKDGLPTFTFKRGDEAKMYNYTLRAIAANNDLDQITTLAGPEALTSIQSGLEQWASQNARAAITPAVINDVLDSSGLQGSARSAMSQYLQAVLRADTGAAYTGTEIADYAGAFLPNPGDDPETVAYKSQKRREQLGYMAAGAGSAGPYLTGILDGTYQIPGKSFFELSGVDQPDPNAVTTTTIPPKGTGALDSSNVAPKAEPPPPLTDAAKAAGVDEAVWGVMTPDERKLFMSEDASPAPAPKPQVTPDMVMKEYGITADDWNGMDEGQKKLLMDGMSATQVLPKEGYVTTPALSSEAVSGIPPEEIAAAKANGIPLEEWIKFPPEAKRLYLSN